MKKVKIGIFSGYFLPHLGGVERYVDKLSDALIKRGYEIVIVTSNHEDLPHKERLGARTIYRIPIHGFARARYPLPKRDKEYKEIMKAVKGERIDVFLLNTRFHLTSLIGAKLGKSEGKHVMLIEHGTDHFTVNNTFLDFFGKIYEHILTWVIKRHVDGFYGVSGKCNVWLKHFSIRASGIFYNSVDPDDVKHVKDLYQSTYRSDEVVITYAGRLIREKGILNLLEAFNRLRSDMPKTSLRLVVAGDGDLLEHIKSNYDDSSIDITGRLDFDHVMALFKRTDIFVYPSQYPEGLPTSILEAGLMHCAVIATPRGGTEEVITNGQHGIITDGSVDDLYASLEELCLNKQKRQQYAGALQDRVKKVFNWSTVAQQVDQEINRFKL